MSRQLCDEGSPGELTAYVAGVGFWASGLPSWACARQFVATGALPVSPPAFPSPTLLSANDRRRCPASVAIALEVAHAACVDSGIDPQSLPTVFASTYGDLPIADYVCSTLATDPRSMSPIRFLNSVHNAVAGYWTINSGSLKPATSICSNEATFAQGLLEALVQLANGEPAVLLAGYDTQSEEPLRGLVDSRGLLGGALVLHREVGSVRISAQLEDGHAPRGGGPLSVFASTNAMAPMLPLFDCLSSGVHDAVLSVGPGRILRVKVETTQP